MVVVGLGAAVALIAGPWLGRRALVAVAGLALAAGLAGPLAFSVATEATPHSGALPVAGPSSGAGFGGPGGFGGAGVRGGRFAGGVAGGPGSAAGGTSALPTPPGGGVTGAGNGLPGAGAGAGAGAGGFGGGGFGGGGFGGARGGVGGGAAGGLLNGSSPSKALVAALETDNTGYTWIAATVGANTASGYQLSTGQPVMAIGGFNGTDPAPTLAQFEKYVAAGRIHWFIAGGGFGGGGAFGGAGSGGTSSVATQITSWVESHYTARTVGGVTIYDLATPAT